MIRYKLRTHNFETDPYYYLIKLHNKKAKRLIDNMVNWIEDVNITKCRSCTLTINRKMEKSI